MTPFAIVADLRTGSTLLSSTLDLHPEIRCYGEIFHSADLPDNRPGGINRSALSGHDLVRCALAARDVGAVGFRAMIGFPFPDRPQWADAWEVLRSVAGLRVIYLVRNDRLAQYTSLQIAQETGQFHPHDGDPVLRSENRPTVTVDPDEFRRWSAERERLFELRRRQLQGMAALELSYERLTGEWPATIRTVQDFLEVDSVPLKPAKRRQETRPLDVVIENATELRAELAPAPRT